MSPRHLYAAVVVVSLALAGCTAPTGLPPEGGSTASGSETPAEQTAVPVEAMTPADKRASIAEDFPLEVPVPSGTVARGGSQGGEAWEYAVVVPTSPQVLADWYRAAYASRSWELVGDAVAGTADGGSPETTRYELTFRKAAAESRITVSATSPAGDEARAVVILGVGAPVLETQ